MQRYKNRVADPVLFTPWIRDEFFPDPGVKFFGEIFLNFRKHICFSIFLLKGLATETMRSKKKIGFTGIYHPSFYVQ
jgi:hypothetical protein